MTNEQVFGVLVILVALLAPFVWLLRQGPPDHDHAWSDAAEFQDTPGPFV